MAPREGNAKPVDEPSKGGSSGMNNDCVVVVKGLNEYVNEEAVRRTFASYGTLKEAPLSTPQFLLTVPRPVDVLWAIRQVRLMRDKYTQLVNGSALIEYQQMQHALYVCEVHHCFAEM